MYFLELLLNKGRGTMKPTTDTQKKQEQDQAVVPIQTMVPVVPETSTKSGPSNIVTVFFGILTLAAMGVVIWAVLTRRGSYYQPADVLQENYVRPDAVTKQNFHIRINIDGEKCIESVHSDSRENIVTFHYTGENGKDGGMAVYDFNQGLAAVKDGNETACFFTNTNYLPALELANLQLSARNKEVLEVSETVQLQIKGLIPYEFLETSGGPIFSDLCRSLPSFWLTEVTPQEANRLRRGTSAGSLSISISVPAGGSATIIVLGGAGKDGGIFEVIFG